MNRCGCTKKSRAAGNISGAELSSSWPIQRTRADVGSCSSAGPIEADATHEAFEQRFSDLNHRPNGAG